jgi:hypothetical protein
MVTRLLACLAVAADFVWKTACGGLLALALGTIAVFGGRGLADAGVPTAWLWLWGILRVHRVRRRAGLLGDECLETLGRRRSRDPAKICPNTSGTTGDGLRGQGS